MAVHQPSDERPEARGPVALGCGLLVAAVALAGLVASLCVVFIESGATGDSLVLDTPGAYAPNSVTFLGQQNLYLVRVGAGFVALSDLDAANRASPGRRCRAAPIALDDPALRATVDHYRGRMSPEGAGTLVFRETCNGALYDAAGIRLDQDGPNLDRYHVRIREDGRLEVQLDARECTSRSPEALSEARACVVAAGVTAR